VNVDIDSLQYLRVSPLTNLMTPNTLKAPRTGRVLRSLTCGPTRLICFASINRSDPTLTFTDTGRLIWGGHRPFCAIPDAAAVTI
jgi:hypothetical protein